MTTLRVLQVSGQHPHGFAPLAFNCPRSIDLSQDNRPKTERFGDYVSMEAQQLHTLRLHLDNGIVSTAWAARKEKSPRALPVAPFGVTVERQCCRTIHNEVRTFLCISERERHLRVGRDLLDLSERGVGSDKKGKVPHITNRFNQSRARPTVLPGRHEKAVSGTPQRRLRDLQAMFYAQVGCALFSLLVDV